MLTSEKTKPRVLIADDSRVVLKTFCKFLQEDYDIVESRDGQEAWKVLEADDTICAVFTDMQMPKVDGLALLQKIRSADNSIIQSLPVILVTSQQEQDERVQLAFSLGVTDLVQKPFNKNLLKSCVRAHIKPRHIAQLNAESEIAEIHPVTKLANKPYFVDRGVKEVGFSVRHQQAISIALLSISEYESLNRQFQSIMPTILTKIGGFIRTIIRQEDTLADLSKGQYGIILLATEYSEATHLLKRIKTSIESKQFSYKGSTISTMTHFGIATLTVGEEWTFDELLNRANVQLSNSIKNIEPPKEVQEIHVESKNIVVKVVASTFSKIISMINKHQANLRSQHSKAIIQEMIPLLEFCNEKHDLKLDEAIEVIKHKCNS